MANYIPTTGLLRAYHLAQTAREYLKEDTKLSHNSTNSTEAEKIKASQNKAEPVSDQARFSPVHDFIHLIDYDYNWKNEPEDGSPQYIKLQVPPLELEYSPEPTWATIPSIGRNAPFYNYSGSEDTLAFRIDWFSTQENRYDVINKCRWLEALTKADAYLGGPHRLLVVWGRENFLFKDTLWIIHKAKYKLMHFQKHQSMLPQQAYQDIVLKKVLKENSTHEDIRHRL